MKKLILILWAALLSTYAVNLNAQNRASQCIHCAMDIRDPQFKAVLTTVNNVNIEFDAIECLVNYLKENDESSFQQIMVADYSSNGLLINARDSYFLKSKNIPSPMGAFISAYPSLKVAEEYQRKSEGDVMDWKSLKLRFKDSRFGSLSNPVHKHHHHHGDYSSIGVMGDHLHHEKGLMFSLRYMYMDMNGLQSGTNQVSDSEVLNNYMVAPQEMSMEMVMLGAMYAPTDRLTIMVMQNIHRNKMRSLNRMSMQFQTESSGLGDMRITALYGLFSKANFSFHINAGLNIPLASINNRDDTPMMQNMKLPYSMQLGSGTTDFILGGTLKGSINRFSWGIQQINTIRVGTNDANYRLGNTYDLSTWTAFQARNWLFVSMRVQAARINPIDFVDAELNPNMAPLADTQNSGSNRVRTFLGTNITFPQNSMLKKLSLGAEFKVFDLEDLEGIQMNENSFLIAGLRYSI